MKRYHIKVIGYRYDNTQTLTIDCDGVNTSSSGCYEFWVKEGNSHEVIAYYPIKSTIIYRIQNNEY